MNSFIPYTTTINYYVDRDVDNFRNLAKINLTRVDCLFPEYNRSTGEERYFIQVNGTQFRVNKEEFDRVSKLLDRFDKF